MAPGTPSKLKQLLNALSKPWTMHFGALGNQRKASAVGFSGLGAASDVLKRKLIAFSRPREMHLELVGSFGSSISVRN